MYLMMEKINIRKSSNSIGQYWKSNSTMPWLRTDEDKVTDTLGKENKEDNPLSTHSFAIR